MVVFAIAYTAYKSFHITVRILISKLSERPLAILDIMHALLGIGILLIVILANVMVIRERWHTEITDVLLVPVPPFRCVWTIGLIVFSLVLCTDFIGTIRKVIQK